MKFVWDQKYSVGIEGIDEQHRHFFAMADRLQEIARTKSWDRNEVMDLFRKFADYTEHHLETEERLFKKYRYPDAMRQRIEHDEYRRQVKLKVMQVKEAGADLYAAGADKDPID